VGSGSCRLDNLPDLLEAWQDARKKIGVEADEKRSSAARDEALSINRAFCPVDFLSPPCDPFTRLYRRHRHPCHLDTKRRAIFGLAWREHEREAAKDRKEATQAKPGEGKVGAGNVSGTGDSRDKIGQRVGVSGRDKTSG